VHAWWHEPYIDLVNEHLQPGTAMGKNFVHAANAKGSPEYQAMEGLTKGLEIRLPPEHSFSRLPEDERRTRAHPCLLELGKSPIDWCI
jgi:hypothetical protein